MSGMTPERLRSLLSASRGEAVPAFLSLLDDPGTTLHIDAEEHSSPTAILLTIYRRRGDHVRRIGLPTLGFDETVEKLEATGHEQLTAALGTGPGGHPSCIAFLSPDLSEVVAAVAVLGPPPEA